LPVDRHCYPTQIENIVLEMPFQSSGQENDRIELTYHT